MKLNKILMVLAATAIVGCTSEDLNDFSAKQAPEDSRLIELDENFAIAGVGVDGAATRTHWAMDAGGAVVNVFLPTYANNVAAGALLHDPTSATPAAALNQTVGLCWLGETVGENVYTNYQFYHYGWLNNGETLPAFDKCPPYALNNGSWYSDITLKANVTAGNEAVPATDFTLPAQSATSGLNYNSGIYKTDNKAIFGGNYIVYYPFNEEFKEVGTIPALAVTQFGDGVATSAPKIVGDPALGEATFRYSKAVEIKGGGQAAGFGLTNLSELLQLKVFTPSGDANIGKKIDKIVLYSQSEKLLKQANLRADKIVEGKKGVELYAEGSTVGTKTITINFKAGDEIALAKEADAALGAFITVLPTTVEDLKIFVHNQDDKTWAVIDKANQQFNAAADRIRVSVKATDFSSNYFAFDQASLEEALTEARAAGVPSEIEVIGDITLTANLLINNPADANITIKGDDIIVPEDKTLTLATNMVSDVRVLGKECCGAATKGGRLVIEGGKITKVTMEPTKVEGDLTEVQYNDYNPLVTYAAGAADPIVAAGVFDAQAGNIVVNSPVQHKGNLTIAEGVKVLVDGTAGNAGDLNFMGSTVVNNGTIEVTKGGKFDMTDASGNATATDGQRMTNNGTFIHNVDAGVGTAVQSMVQNGEYRCRVDKQEKLDDALLQWTACSVIEMVDAGTTYDLGTAADIETKDDGTTAWKHKGKYIDYEVNTTSPTTFINPADGDGNGDNENIQVGNLTVKAGGLGVNYVKGTGKRQLTVNGDMKVSAATNLISSQKVTVTKNLNVEGAELRYLGAKQNEEGLAVGQDITVSGAGGNFNAGFLNCLDITCANFTLADHAEAHFGNRTGGADKNLVVSGTITNPATCTFDIKAANQVGSSILAWVTCKTLIVGGTFTAAQPRVQ